MWSWDEVHIGVVKRLMFGWTYIILSPVYESLGRLGFGKSTNMVLADARNHELVVRQLCRRPGWIIRKVGDRVPGLVMIFSITSPATPAGFPPSFKSPGLIMVFPVAFNLCDCELSSKRSIVRGSAVEGSIERVHNCKVKGVVAFPSQAQISIEAP